MRKLWIGICLSSLLFVTGCGENLEKQKVEELRNEVEELKRINYLLKEIVALSEKRTEFYFRSYESKTFKKITKEEMLKMIPYQYGVVMKQGRPPVYTLEILYKGYIRVETKPLNN